MLFGGQYLIYDWPEKHSLYGWPPVLLISVHLLCLCLINNKILVWLNPYQSNRRTNVLWEIPLTETEVCDKYLISVFLSAFAVKDSDQRWKVEGGNVWWEFLNFLFLNHSFKCDDVDVDYKSSMLLTFAIRERGNSWNFPLRKNQLWKWI